MMDILWIAQSEISEKMEVYPSIVAQLDPNDEGIIHLGVGVYFEVVDKEEENTDQKIRNPLIRQTKLAE